MKLLTMHLRNSQVDKYQIRAGLLYTQYPIIRNGLIRNRAELLGKFKKRALGRSNLRNASKNLRTLRGQIFKAKKKVISFTWM